MSPHIQALRAACIEAVQWHTAMAERRHARARAWLRRRDAHETAWRATPPCNPLHARANLLADIAAWRAMAWTALAQLDAHEAARCRLGAVLAARHLRALGVRQ